MKLQEQFSKLMVTEGALQDLQAILKGDKEMSKSKKDVDFLDNFWQKHEDEIDKIQKKYKLGFDELGELLMKLKK